MKYKTAVEWLEDNLMMNPFIEKDFTNNVKVFKKAKKMEKKQIIDAYDRGVWDVGCRNSDSEKYYKETYVNK